MTVKVAIVALTLAVSCACNVFLAYRWIDAGVTIDHLLVDGQHLRDRAALCLAALNAAWRGRSESDLNRLAEEMKGRAEIALTREERFASLGDLRFELVNGKIASVSYLGEAGREGNNR
jgi:hypothetical protein